ncbi:MAG: hypothetical protein SFX74_13005 [Fimbriimonadaceae bacterium]|nr:hypothetical protein [Fimbriimonadaceae bacterium]
MSDGVHVSISDVHVMRITVVGLGHRIELLNGPEVVAQTESADLSRLVKRAGTIVAAPPLELRNEHRRILVRLFGRPIGEIEKDHLHRALSEGTSVRG